MISSLAVFLFSCLCISRQKQCMNFVFLIIDLVIILKEKMICWIKICKWCWVVFIETSGKCQSAPNYANSWTVLIIPDRSVAKQWLNKNCECMIVIDSALYKSWQWSGKRRPTFRCNASLVSHVWNALLCWLHANINTIHHLNVN